jgi:superkiller protein 3
MAKYDIAIIHVELGHFADAIAIYEQLDAAKPSEVGILAALAGARLSQGREMLNGGFRQRAKHAFLEASAKAQDVIKLDRQYRTWGWKVVADAAFEMNGLGVDEEDLEVLASASELLVQQDEDKRAAIAGVRDFSDALNGNSASHEGSETLPLRLAAKAFTWRAYLLRDERAPIVMSALYDQAAALHMLVRATSDEDEKSAAAKAAITALRRALDKDSSDERLWNALGVLCAEGGKAVAQHAFVVSLDLYTKVCPVSSGV